MKGAAILCLGAAIGLQVTRDRLYPPGDSVGEPLMYLRSPQGVGRIVLGFDALAADVYWIRALQHFGRQRLAPPDEPRDYSLLYPLLDLTTSLDPHFRAAYRFGAVFLSEPYPGGAGRPDLAVALLRKGIAADPQRWEYYHDIGFVQYWSLRDPAAAATWLRRAAQQPDAPNWLEPVAAAILTQGRDRTSARYLWTQMLSASETWLRQRAALALAQLDALDQIDRLHDLVARVPHASGQPYSWRGLVNAGHLEGLPVDPSGTPYVLHPATGRVSVSERSPLFPMPRPIEP